MTACPGTDTLAELVCRRVPAGALENLEAHLAGCAPCRQVVGTLAVASLGSIAKSGEPFAADPAPPRDPAQRYVIVRELARGGMGRISIAEDTLLHRQVAIKEVRSPASGLAARFARELELTARLQHPAIVTIHDAGTWPDGVPFFAMRLVSGEPLDRVIERQRDVTARLGLLPHAIAVVDALAYAHAQAIIHRDLKPQNVVIGEFGETVVIDWGLAKDLRRDVEPGDAELVGTPAYMAPEQARGEPADERSDVYALGAILYHLLGGVPPHAGADVSELVHAVATTSPVPLGERAPEVPADLIAIVAKAMAPARGDRYASAAELAIDLKRFERGQLVGAHRYSSLQLVGRWVRKHRTAVAVAAIALVALATVTTASFMRITAAQHRAERDRADAEDLMQFMLTDLHDQLKSLGKLDILGAVATKERAYFDAHPEDDSPRRVAALGNLGDVLAAKGDAAAARAEDHAAIALAEQLARTDPAALPGLAAAHGQLADLLFDQGELAGSIAETRAAIRVERQLIAQRPDDPNPKLGTAHLLLRLGQTLEMSNQTDDALASYRDALTLVASAGGAGARDSAGNAKVGFELAQAHERLGHALYARGDLAHALIEQRAALAGIAQLAADDPGDVRWKQELVVARNAIGGSLEPSDPVAALVEYRAAEAIAVELVAHDANDMTWQRMLVNTRGLLARMLSAQGDVAGAIAVDRELLLTVSALAARAPNDASLERMLYHVHFDLGDELSAGDPAAALAEFTAALPLVEAAAARDRSNVNAQNDLVVTRNNIGGLRLDRGDIAGGLAMYRSALDVIAPLAEQEPTKIMLAESELGAREGVGEALLRQHDPAGALAQYREALAHATRLAASAPDDASLARYVELAHGRVGNALLANHAASDAVAEYRAAADIADAHVGAHPDTSWQDALADDRAKIGDALEATGAHAQALVEYRAALAVAKTVAAADRTNTAWQERVTELARKAR